MPARYLQGCQQKGHVALIEPSRNETLLKQVADFTWLVLAGASRQKGERFTQSTVHIYSKILPVTTADSCIETFRAVFLANCGDPHDQASPGEAAPLSTSDAIRPEGSK